MSIQEREAAHQRALLAPFVTIDDTPAEETGLLCAEQIGGLRSWAQMVGYYDAPLPLKFWRVEGGWLYASVGTQFEIIARPNSAHLLILHSHLIVKVECYCICGMHIERPAPAADCYFFPLDALHFEMYTQLRRTFYQIYGVRSKSLPLWVVDELARTQMALIAR